MTRVVFLSDPHLSPTHGFFWQNWLLARDAAARVDAACTIVNGDLCIDGPDSDAEMAFAATALALLPGTVLPLPGNHDIGDEPPGQDPNQIVNEARLARWDTFIGADRWRFRLDGWTLLGVNAQLFGSGLAREAEQNDWLDAMLAESRGDRVGLVLHKPLFVESPDEALPSIASLGPAPRGELVQRLCRADIRLVVSGHLHKHRDRSIDGLRHLWLPSLAFSGGRGLDGDARCGFAVLDFDGDHVGVEIVRPQGIVSHDLDAIKQHGRYRFLREMPPCPPELAA
ncbi:metallophosphoesterase [Bosea caraganae]|uniref:Metallophosphoesterase n=1 Tax=Bosea caraganae TaxID=2763117 RepID=A0A370L7X1_9HYPH|nr:metallophosphoesterase [Bosea caraganae]RDJ25428.1 metallophosphoesterase [Bosea caraganae]RDJ25787.1 metallophosphoesterase [Bosea caraganae]